MAHANARLGPAGRRELVRLMIEVGMPERQAAVALRVSPCTRIGGRPAGLRPARSSAARGPGRRIARVGRVARRGARRPRLRRGCWRARTDGLGPRLIAGRVGLAHATVRAICAGTVAHARRAPARGVPALRVAVSRRSVAHGHQALPALPPARAPVHRRRAQTSTEMTPSSATTTATRSSTTTPAWPTPSCSPTTAHRR